MRGATVTTNCDLCMWMSSSHVMYVYLVDKNKMTVENTKEVPHINSFILSRKDPLIQLKVMRERG